MNKRLLFLLLVIGFGQINKAETEKITDFIDCDDSEILQIYEILRKRYEINKDFPELKIVKHDSVGSANYQHSSNRIYLPRNYKSNKTLFTIFSLIHEIGHYKQWRDKNHVLNEDVQRYYEIKILSIVKNNPEVQTDSKCRKFLMKYENILNNPKKFAEQESFLKVLQESDADHFAVSQIQCPVCLKMMQYHRGQDDVNGYMGYADFVSPIKDRMHRNIYCKAHQSACFKRALSDAMLKEQRDCGNYKVIREGSCDDKHCLGNCARDKCLHSVFKHKEILDGLHERNNVSLVDTLR